MDIDFATDALTLDDAIDRVREGAAFLDAQVPNWRAGIDPFDLDLRSHTQCVLGQLFGHYNDGMQALGLGWVELEHYGFDSDDDADFPLLTEAWAMALEQAR
jgi:hypothetical protein